MPSLSLIHVTILSACFLILILTLAFLYKNRQSKKAETQSLNDKIHQFEQNILKELKDNQVLLIQKVYQGQIENLNNLQTSLHGNMQEIRAQLGEHLKQHSEFLTQELRQNLFQINQQVQQRLGEGLEKNAATFHDVIKRLTIIDEAQKKITDLSSNVISLQEILSDKRSRGAFGEVQLSSLINNMIPPNHYSLQHTLSNGKRADCMLFLPHPTGNIVIDAKFPLETYQQISICQNDLEKNRLAQQFRLDIKKHIKDIAEKYIIPQETADSAVMFIPSEAIFAEIHAVYPELVQFSHECRVWLVSPTTLMAVLTTARAVLKDDATRKQVHIIQEHLKLLSQDFKRFDKRMQSLTRHIQQANEDVSDVNTSARKITSRFDKIEHLEIEEAALETPVEIS